MAVRPVVTWQLVFQPEVVDKLSFIEPYNKCTCKIWVDQDFTEFRARIVKDGNPIDPFTGTLIYNTTNGTAGTVYEFDIVSQTHMLDGEGIYRVGLYAKTSDGYWNVGAFFKVSSGAYFLTSPNSTKIVVADPEEPPTENPYITFSSPTDFTLCYYNSSYSKTSKSTWCNLGGLEYSTDKNTWNTLSETADLTQTISSVNGKLYLRGTYDDDMRSAGAAYDNPQISERGLAYITIGPRGNMVYHYKVYASARLVITGGNVSITGNLKYLIDYAQTDTKVIKPGAFGYMFDGSSFTLTGIPTLPSDYTYSPYIVRNIFNGFSNVKFSETQTEECPNAYTIPEFTASSYETKYPALDSMFTGTSGTFTGTPVAGTTYYTNMQV